MFNSMGLIIRLFVLSLGWLLVMPVYAEMTIEIVGGGNSRHAIAVMPFKDELMHAGPSLTPVIRSDLNLSGMFRVLDTSSVADIPFDITQIHYPVWRAQGAQSMVVGHVESVAEGKVSIRFKLVNIAQKTVLTSGQFTVPPEQVRHVAHVIADMIYQAITGQRGFFTTRIAYVLKSGRGYQLQVADVDGARAQTVLRSREPIMSLSWSPNGRFLAYVSFETQKPVVWVQDLATGARRPVANFKGSNSAPVWSPDGKTLAIVLTTSGHSQIYLLNLASGSTRRLSYSDAIETEPAFTPDGSQILFVSDRAGGPQIYTIPITGGSARRLTWEGAYNVSPVVAPDGKNFAYIRRSEGKFRVVVQDLMSGENHFVSAGPDNERPSFAPNGRMILYASSERGKSVLFATTLDGNSKVKLGMIDGDIQDPAWGPAGEN